MRPRRFETDDACKPVDRAGTHGDAPFGYLAGTRAAATLDDAPA